MIESEYLTPFQHRLTITEREAVVVDGVNNVESFDDQGSGSGDHNRDADITR